MKVSSLRKTANVLFKVFSLKFYIYIYNLEASKHFSWRALGSAAYSLPHDSGEENPIEGDSFIHPSINKALVPLCGICCDSPFPQRTMVQ